MNGLKHYAYLDPHIKLLELLMRLDLSNPKTEGTTVIFSISVQSLIKTYKKNECLHHQLNILFFLDKKLAITIFYR